MAEIIVWIFFGIACFVAGMLINALYFKWDERQAFGFYHAAYATMLQEAQNQRKE